MAVGDLAELVGILDWSKETLLGAFLEIACEKNPEKRWHSKGQDQLRSDCGIVWITLNKKPDPSTLKKLRTLKFFFDPFKTALFGPISHKKEAEKFLKIIS